MVTCPQNQQSAINDGRLFLKSGLYLSGQCAEIAHTLQFIVGKLNVKMILELRQKIERLQAVDTERLEKIVVRRKLLARHLEVSGSQIEDFG